MSDPITFELSPAARALLEQIKDMPFAMRRAIVRGMDRAGLLTVSHIQEQRLTGQGPFPVEEHRLGVVTSRLRTSLRWSSAAANGDTVTGGIGSNVIYAAIHEFGGIINRTVKAGTARLREERDGSLLKRGNLATFAKKSHKRVREVPYAGGKQYQIHMPARAPIGHGIADNLPVFEREIMAEVGQILRGGPQT